MLLVLWNFDRLGLPYFITVFLDGTVTGELPNASNVFDAHCHPFFAVLNIGRYIHNNDN